MKIVLVGGSGFLGRHLLYDLCTQGHHCVVLTRAAVRRGELVLCKHVELVQADVHDVSALTAQFEAADAVISMAGILNQRSGRANDFHSVHVKLVDNIIKACQLTGVARLLHVSALNAGHGDSRYLQTKGEAELLLQNAQNLNVTIFQPSVVFAKGDAFFNRFAAMLRLMPVIPLACPATRLQPVYAGDVSTVMAASLDDPMTWGKSYELGGPHVYTLKQLLRWTTDHLGLRRAIVGLPGPLSWLMATMMGALPGKPFSLDNYRSLQTDNIIMENGFAYFGMYPRAIESVVPDYLDGSVHQRRLQSFRAGHHRQ